jgi:hypothetical protein
VTYTQLATLAVVGSALLDVVVLRTRLLGRRTFWVSYLIILAFQLLTNGVLTGERIVRYDGSAIIGSSTATGAGAGAPAFIGDGRIAFAPVEDLLFGFALVLQTLSWWVFWGRQGVEVANPARHE